MADERDPRQRVIDACYEFMDAMTLVTHTVGHLGFDDGQLALLESAEKKLDQVYLEAVRDGI